MVLRIALCVGKKLCAAVLAVTPKCVGCGWAVESLGHIFFHCSVELIECYMFRIEASSVCRNVLPQLKKNEDRVLVFTWHYAYRYLDDPRESFMEVRSFRQLN